MIDWTSLRPQRLVPLFRECKTADETWETFCLHLLTNHHDEPFSRSSLECDICNTLIYQEEMQRQIEQARAAGTYTEPADVIAHFDGAAQR
jgi:hypothetical protein